MWKKFNVDVNVICFLRKTKARYKVYVSGAHYYEPAATPYSFHGVFPDRSIFSLNLSRIQIPTGTSVTNAIISTDCLCIGLLWQFQAPSNGLLRVYEIKFEFRSVGLCGGFLFLSFFLYLFTCLFLYLLISPFLYFRFPYSFFLSFLLLFFYIFRACF